MGGYPSSRCDGLDADVGAAWWRSLTRPGLGRSAGVCARESDRSRRAGPRPYCLRAADPTASAQAMHARAVRGRPERSVVRACGASSRLGARVCRRRRSMARWRTRRWSPGRKWCPVAHQVATQVAAPRVRGAGRSCGERIVSRPHTLRVVSSMSEGPMPGNVEFVDGCQAWVRSVGDDALSEGVNIAGEASEFRSLWCRRFRRAQAPVAVSPSGDEGGVTLRRRPVPVPINRGCALTDSLWVGPRGRSSSAMASMTREEWSTWESTAPET